MLCGCAPRTDSMATGSLSSIDSKVTSVADVSYTVDGTRFVINSNLIFENDRKTLKPEAPSVLRALFDQVTKEFFTEVHIIAHCDDSISRKRAEETTTQQAEEIAGYFWFRGIDASEICFEGAGFSQPIADMDTPEGIYINQRIELMLT